MAPAISSDNVREPPIFSVVLTPHRSLGPTGFLAVMLLLSVLSTGVGIVFWSIGAWPIPGFLGLDVLALYAAFRLSYRQARAAEVIHLSRSALTVRRIAPDGTSAETGLNPYWVRFEIDRHPEFGIQRMVIAWQGHRLSVGRFLGTNERERFAREFSAALATARATPVVN